MALNQTRSLDLSSTDIGVEGATRLAKLIEKTPLSTLNLNNNNLGDEGASRIAKAVRTNTTLTSLHLNNCGIGDQGVTTIAIALRANSSIQSLHLNRNLITDKGATKLATALQSNTSLQSLQLNDNKIGMNGILELTACISNNSILSIELNNNVGSSFNDTSTSVAQQSSLKLESAHYQHSKILVCDETSSPRVIQIPSVISPKLLKEHLIKQLSPQKLKGKRIFIPLDCVQGTSDTPISFADQPIIYLHNKKKGDIIMSPSTLSKAHNSNDSILSIPDTSMFDINQYIMNASKHYGVEIKLRDANTIVINYGVNSSLAAKALQQATSPVQILLPAKYSNSILDLHRTNTLRQWTNKLHLKYTLEIYVQGVSDGITEDVLMLTLLGDHVNMGKLLREVDDKATKKEPTDDNHTVEYPTDKLLQQSFFSIWFGVPDNISWDHLVTEGKKFVNENWSACLPPLAYINTNPFLSNQHTLSVTRFKMAVRKLHPYSVSPKQRTDNGTFPSVNDGLFAWHRTSSAATLPICKDGFDRGEYFGVNAAISRGYCGDSKELLLAYLLSGSHLSTYSDNCYIVNNPSNRELTFNIPLLIVGFEETRTEEFKPTTIIQQSSGDVSINVKEESRFNVPHFIKHLQTRYPNLKISKDNSTKGGLIFSGVDALKAAECVQAVTAPIDATPADPTTIAALCSLEDSSQLKTWAGKFNLAYTLKRSDTGGIKFSMYGSHIHIGKLLRKVDEHITQKVQKQPASVKSLPSTKKPVPPPSIDLDLSHLIKPGIEFVKQNWPLDLPPLSFVEQNNLLNSSICLAKTRFIRGVWEIHPHGASSQGNFPHETKDGFFAWHGTVDQAVAPICKDGFDPSRRAGQVYGVGEYFGVNASVSFGYCKGGQRMILAYILNSKAVTRHRNFCYVVNNPVDWNSSYCLPLIVLSWGDNVQSVLPILDQNVKTSWTSPWCWQWEEDGHQWMPYTNVVNSVIEHNFTNGTNSFVTPPITRLKDGKLQTYEVQFQSMLQKNTSTNYTRNITRVSNPVFKAVTIVGWKGTTTNIDLKAINAAFGNYINNQGSSRMLLTVQNKPFVLDFAAGQVTSLLEGSSYPLMSK